MERVPIENKSIKNYYGRWDHLSSRKVVLYRRWDSGEGEEVRWQFVTSLNARNEILRERQTKETARHLGINKTLERVKERFRWPGCTKEVKDCCRACNLFISRERPTRTPRVRPTVLVPPWKRGSAPISTAAWVRPWQQIHSYRRRLLFFEVDGSQHDCLLQYALLGNYHAVVMGEVVQQKVEEVTHMCFCD